MAAYSGNFTNGRRPQASGSRNIAFLSIFAVLAGGYLALRAQSPSKNEPLVSKKEVETMQGSPPGQGNRVGRAPSHQPKE
ncbi:hypothetical protein IFM51744_08293 [Aspergillus udagawae]|uniref:Uncharacterized protein n=1 Tax=Aspergillus udagawae TaxID=91492 RepID=A0A8H3NK28_9EURO|nr:hypothetical protein IFM46972_04586 [Aspergillus udagawae]GFF54156.1 hypothetical protein IFM51744_08293 [Aspergillus udagawae]GFF89426.1 hypothetical protein IFM53868_05834 [Aspergillus udagawae]GFG15608.1 hypothetical protein IFM5058_07539 [Aspergillus udagawae]